MYSSPRLFLAATRYSFEASVAYTWSFRSILVCSLMALIGAASYAAVPDLPVPLAIELHPPFQGTYWGLAETDDGRLVVGGIGTVGVFDGVRWRELQVPGAFGIKAILC